MRRAGRFFLDSSTLKHLGTRQLRWTAGATAGSVVLALSPAADIPELALVPIGAGIACAFTRSGMIRTAVLVVGVGAAFLAGIVHPDASTLSSVLSASPRLPARLHLIQRVLGLFVMGALLPALDGGPRSIIRSLESGLALVSAGSLAVWAVNGLVSPAWLVASQMVAGGLIGGLVSSAALLVLAVRHRRTERIPDRDTIARTLRAHYRTPALLAWKLDAELHAMSPDPDTREGLAEVAAWVYRLQRTRQRLGDAENSISEPVLAQRLMDLSHRASVEPDRFARDRMLASIRHLERMQHHRERLASERARATALCEFATVFLEEARTELTLAGIQEVAPNHDRLPQVLRRLRSYSADRAHARTTRQEMFALAR